MKYLLIQAVYISCINVTAENFDPLIDCIPMIIFVAFKKRRIGCTISFIIHGNIGKTRSSCKTILFLSPTLDYNLPKNIKIDLVLCQGGLSV